MIRTLGMLELRSIAKGIQTADVVTKAADVEIIFSKTTCPGKYLILISGDVGAVKEAVEAGVKNAENYLVDSFLIPSVHTDVINGIKGKIKKENIDAIGVFETFSISSGIVALDTALKASQTRLIKLNLGLAIGGKCYFILTGDVSSVNEAINAAENMMDNKKILEKVIIPYPSEELINSLT